MKAQTIANRLKADADVFSIKPETLASIEIHREITIVAEQLRILSSDFTLDFDPAPLRSALDKVRQNVLGLEVLLKERFGE